MLYGNLNKGDDDSFGKKSEIITHATYSCYKMLIMNTITYDPASLLTIIIFIIIHQMIRRIRCWHLKIEAVLLGMDTISFSRKLGKWFGTRIVFSTNKGMFSPSFVSERSKWHFKQFQTEIMVIFPHHKSISYTATEISCQCSKLLQNPHLGKSKWP